MILARLCVYVVVAPLGSTALISTLEAVICVKGCLLKTF